VSPLGAATTSHRQCPTLTLAACIHCSAAREDHIWELPVPVFEQSNAEVFRVTFYEYRVIPTIMLISTNR
jgi:hypothetical protein